MLRDFLNKFSSSTILHTYVKVQIVLIYFIKFYDIWMIKFLKNINFIRKLCFFSLNLGFFYNLYCKQFLIIWFHLCHHDLSENSQAHHFSERIYFVNICCRCENIRTIRCFDDLNLIRFIWLYTATHLI